MTSLKRIDKIFVLSNYHKEYFCKKYGEEYRNKIKISMNGIHNELYKKNNNKENSMIWSSCYERGLEFFINYVLPKIKKEIPDFKLKVCSYNIPKHFSNVITLGQLNKEQLAKEQCSAKIWCYPNLGYSSFGIDFRETFCITAVENAAAGNCILTTNLGGLGTTCNGINFLKNDFYNNEKILDLENYGNYLADMCIKALKNEFFTTFNFEKYTWENAAKSLL